MKYKDKLIKKALSIDPSAVPCGGRDSFDECFTINNLNKIKVLSLWYDTDDKSTRMIMCNYDTGEIIHNINGGKNEQEIYI